MPPCRFFCGFGFWCFFTMLTFSISTRPSARTPLTVPWRPLSRPVITATRSPFLMRFMSQHLRRERDDLHELRRAQLARHWSENARADRLEFVGQEHRGVAVEADQRAVRPAHALAGAHHDGVVDLALLDLVAAG